MHYDVVVKLRRFESLTLMPFCLEKTIVRKWYLEGLAVFLVGLWLESGKMCKNNNHTFVSLH